MGNKFTVCMDRDKDKERLNCQVSINSPAPVQRKQNFSQLNNYLEDIRKSQQLNENDNRSHSCRRRFKCHKSNESLFSPMPKKYYQSEQTSSSCQNIKIVILQYYELKTFLCSNKHLFVDQVFPNPFKMSDVMIVLRKLDQNEFIVDLDLVFKQFSCPLSQLTRLYMFLHQYLSQNENQYVGYFATTDKNNIVVDIIVRKMNKKLAKYTKVELQMPEIYSVNEIQEIVDFRMEDNMICQGALDIVCDRVAQDMHVMIFSQKETYRQINNISVLSIGVEQLGDKLINEEICDKIDMICANEDLQLISFLPSLRRKQIFILMQVLKMK